MLKVLTGLSLEVNRCAILLPRSTRLSPFFFSWDEEGSFTELAISAISREKGDSATESGASLLCI